MKKILYGIITGLFLMGSSLFAADGDLIVNGNAGIGTTAPNTTLDLNGAQSVRGMASPSVSPSGQGRIYFDSTANRFKVSENGGPYVDLLGVTTNWNTVQSDSLLITSVSANTAFTDVLSATINITGTKILASVTCGWSRNVGAYSNNLYQQVNLDSGANIQRLPDLGGVTPGGATSLVLNGGGDFLFTGLSSGSHTVKYQIATSNVTGEVWSTNTGQCRLFLEEDTSGGSSGSSQWTTSGSDIYYNTGKVGIGTTSPVSSVNVVGSAGNNWGTNGWNRSIEIPNAAVIKWKKGATNAWGIGQTNNNLYFGVSTVDDNSSAVTYPMYMSSGTVFFNVATAMGNNSSYGGIDSAGTNRGLLYMDNSNPDKVHIRNNQRGAGGAIVFESKAGAVESARFDVNGNFGIGTTIPGYKLDVQGGQINASGGLCISGSCKTDWSQVGGASQWTTSGSNIYYNTGNIGIGTTTPGAKLEVNTWAGSAPAGFNPILNLVGGYVGNNTQGHSIDFHINTLDYYPASRIVSTMSTGGGGELQFHTSSWYPTTPAAARMTITSGGNVGIGTTTPSYTLTVNGSSWTSNGAWSGSDIRWKKNIMPINATLDKILKLKGVNYEWGKDKFKAINFSEGKQIGLIAQDVEKVFPELVRTDNDGYKAISYERLSVLLMKAMQEIAVALDITEAGSSSPSIKSAYKGNEAALAIDKDGNLGVGTNNPSSRLDVKGDIKTSGGISAASLASSGSITAHGNIVQSSPDLNNYGISLERTDEDTKYHAWTFWQMNDHDNNKNALEIWEYKANGKGEACTASGILCSPRLVIKEGGNIGIGDDPGNYKLYVNGDLSVNGNTYSKTGQWLLLSDIRFKENITPIESPLEKVLNIEGVSFNWKKEEFRGQKIPEGMHYGVIAQQVENVIPEVVKTDTSGEKSVAYTEIIPVLIEAIKEQQKKIKELEDKINTLEKDIK